MLTLSFSFTSFAATTAIGASLRLSLSCCFLLSVLDSGVDTRAFGSRRGGHQTCPCPLRPVITIASLVPIPIAIPIPIQSRGWQWHIFLALSSHVHVNMLGIYCLESLAWQRKWHCLSAVVLAIVVVVVVAVLLPVWTPFCSFCEESCIIFFMCAR